MKDSGARVIYDRNKIVIWYIALVVTAQFAYVILNATGVFSHG